MQSLIHIKVYFGYPGNKTPQS